MRFYIKIEPHPEGGLKTRRRTWPFIILTFLFCGRLRWLLCLEHNLRQLPNWFSFSYREVTTVEYPVRSPRRVAHSLRTYSSDWSAADPQVNCQDNNLSALVRWEQTETVF